MKRLSENLVKLRQERRFSQTYIAGMLGISVRTYQRYETGERLPDLPAAVKLADFYHVSVDFLLGRQAEASTAQRNGTLCRKSP